MKRIVGTGLIWLMAALLLVQTAFAAGGQAANITLNQVQQNGPNLTMYVNLYDGTGYPVTGGFAPEQFLVSVDGNAAVVDSVQGYDPAVQGIHYVFAVDVSETVKTKMMDSVRAGLNAFVDRMGPNDTVTIITFGENVTERLAATGDRDAIYGTIAGIVPNELETALYQGVIAAVNAAAGTRSAVVIITDGKNTLQNSTKEDIFAQLRAAQVPLYCIGLNDNDGVDKESLTELSGATGGREFDGPASAIGGSLDTVYALVTGAVELHATMSNPEGKTSFSEPSTFLVGFQTENGYLPSNELQQIVNWTSVPAPAAEVTPTPVPQIALELDANSTAVMYTPGGSTVISGLIGVEQGVVAPEALSITVNDEAWRITSLMRNGNDYTFSAEGVIAGGVDQLSVRAVVMSGDGSSNIASRVQTVAVITPTATPAPELNVTLDDPDQVIEYAPGKTVTVSGIIAVQGGADPAGLELYVNGELCEMNLTALQEGQYEFSANTVLPEQAVPELKVQVLLNGANIRSHAQSLAVVLPTPEPDPELRLTLEEESVEYSAGEPLSIRGNIEVVSGNVAPEDLVLYVNSARWTMNLEAMGDGTYHFTATPENELVGELSRLDVRVRLGSNSHVSSEMASVAITTPPPTATPAPTARPEVTPPPTSVPTAAPTAEPEAEAESGAKPELMELLREKWYFVAIGAALLLIAVIVLVVVRKKKPAVVPVEPPVRKQNDERAAAKTVRGDDLDPVGDATVKDGTQKMDGNQAGQAGTVKADSADSDFVGEADGISGVVGLGQGSGTVRLDEEHQGSGTVRLDEEVWRLTVTVKGLSEEPRTLSMSAEDEVVFGRNNSADMIVSDAAVSARHIKLAFDGEGLYISDLDSTNGTKVNGEAIRPNESRRLASGDQVRIGKTTLEFSFDKPELG